MKKIIRKSIYIALVLMIGILGYSLNKNINKGYCDDYVITQAAIDACGTNYADNGILTPPTYITIEVDPDVTNGLIIVGHKGNVVPILKTNIYMPWYKDENIKNNVTSIKFSGDMVYAPNSLHAMFQDCIKLESVDFTNFNTSTIPDDSDYTGMQQIFSGCTSLKNVNFGSTFDTSNVYRMSYAFTNCSSLETLDLSALDTSKVTTTYQMFQGCSSLKSYDESTGKGLKLGSTFLNSGAIAGTQCMFKDCTSLTSLDLTSMNVANVTTFLEMFSGCTSLETLNTTGWTTTNIKNLQKMFYNCSSLQTLNLSHFNTSHVELMDSMFEGCSGLTNLNVSGFNASNLIGSTKSLRAMFKDCSSLTTLDITGFNTTNVENMNYMFSGCSSLSTLDVSGFNVESIYYLKYMFSGCSSLTDLTLFEMPDSIVDIYGLCDGCSSLTTLDLLNSYISNSYTTMYQSGDTVYGIARDCNNLTKIYFGSNLTAWMLDDEPASDGGLFKTKDNQLVKTNIVLPAGTLQTDALYKMICDYDATNNPTGYNWAADNRQIRIYIGDDLTVDPVYDGWKTSLSTATFSAIADQTYTGSAIEPTDFTVTLGATELTVTTDYTVSYSDNTEVGTAIITITGTGDYCGTASTTFNIASAPSSSKKRKKKETTEETEDTSNGDEDNEDENKDEEKQEDKEQEDDEKSEEEKEFEEERYEKVKKVSHVDKAYVNGYVDQTFKPTKNIERAEVAAMLSRLSLEFNKNEDYTNYENTFSDLDSSEWYDNYIGYSVKAGYLKGYLDGTFRPEENMTRAEFTVAVQRMYDVIVNNYNLDKVNFNDIKDEWYEEEVKIMASNEYVEGYANQFDGDRDITRAEACTIINNVIKRLENLKDQKVINNYSDVFTSDWYYEDVTGASVDIDTAKITK